MNANQMIQLHHRTQAHIDDILSKHNPLLPATAAEIQALTFMMAAREELAKEILETGIWN